MADYNYRTLLTEKKDRVLTITLNRPEVLNAVGDGMHDELEDIFYKVGKDYEVAAVILTGAGRGFCSGGDISDMEGRSGISERDAGIGIVSMSARRLIQNILWIEQPIICALNGAAAGLGATLALFCDIIYASDRARIGDTHVKAGLVAGDGGSVIWPLLIGIAKAKELLMTGDLIDATEAERIGLINKVVPHDDLMPTVMALAQRLANGPANAIRGTKYALNKRIWNEFNTSMDVGLILESKSFQHPDHKEAAKAFVEQRPPAYTGTVNPA